MLPFLHDIYLIPCLNALVERGKLLLSRPPTIPYFKQPALCPGARCTPFKGFKNSMIDFPDLFLTRLTATGDLAHLARESLGPELAGEVVQGARFPLVQQAL